MYYLFIFLVVLLIYIFSTIRYFNWSLFTNIFVSATTVGIVAIGMGLIILLGEIDLSVGSTLVITTACSIMAYNLTGGNVLLMILAGIGSGFICGLINGLFVGLAKMHNDGVKGLKSIEMYRWLSWLPVLLLPLAIIGLIVDLIATESIGMISLVFAIIGFVFTLFPFIYAIAVGKVEFRALNEGQEIILNMGLLDESEEKKMKKLFSAWKHLYRINALFNSFEIIYFVLYGILSVVVKGVFKK